MPSKSAAGTATRSSRATKFVIERCQEMPGHRTAARAIYGAYLRWCEEHEPEQPLSYSTLLRVVEAWAPFEDRVKIPRPDGGRGRPALTYQGIVLTRAVDANRVAA